MAVTEKHGDSIKRDTIDAFVKSCPVCITQSARKAKASGHRPILTKGFGSRGQVPRARTCSPHSLV
eukprot:9809908-Alexandrium_andersonii.AAC.1